jgi:hypothetical protein
MKDVSDFYVVFILLNGTLSHLEVKFYEPTGIAYHREPSNDSTWSGCVVKEWERESLDPRNAAALFGGIIEFNAPL